MCKETVQQRRDQLSIKPLTLIFQLQVCQANHLITVPPRRQQKGQVVRSQIKDGAYFCYCASQDTRVPMGGAY